MHAPAVTSTASAARLHFNGIVVSRARKTSLAWYAASPPCDVYVVKKLQDFVTSKGYNFPDSRFRRRVQAPVFPRRIGADILLPKFEPCGAVFELMLEWHNNLERVKTEIWAIGASTGKAVTNFLRSPETL
jgi:hypothetical protein